MPTDECFWLDDSQSLSPRKESGKQYQGKLGSCIGSTRLNFTLQVQSKLFAQEKILGGQRTARLKSKTDEPKGIEQQTKYGQLEAEETIAFRHHNRIAHLI